MATSVFFNNFFSSQEQQLIENLIIESISIYGMDVYYLPRTLTNKDEIYGEDNLSKYKSAYLVDMYIKDVMGFRGEGDFLSKFNLQIRDQMTFTIARRTFFNDIGDEEGLERPREGDLIYFPLNKKTFVIKFVEHEAIFYLLGSLQTYDIVCELFTYSNERFNTGVEDIDKMYEQYSTSTVPKGLLTNDLLPYYLIDENGFKLVQEEYDLDDVDKNADNDEIQQESLDFVDFTVIDPFSEGRI